MGLFRRKKHTQGEAPDDASSQKSGGEPSNHQDSGKDEEELQATPPPPSPQQNESTEGGLAEEQPLRKTSLRASPSDIGESKIPRFGVSPNAIRRPEKLSPKHLQNEENLVNEGEVQLPVPESPHQPKEEKSGEQEEGRTHDTHDHENHHEDLERLDLGDDGEKVKLPKPRIQKRLSTKTIVRRQSVNSPIELQGNNDGFGALANVEFPPVTPIALTGVDSRIHELQVKLDQTELERARAVAALEALQSGQAETVIDLHQKLLDAQNENKLHLSQLSSLRSSNAALLAERSGTTDDTLPMQFHATEEKLTEAEKKISLLEQELEKQKRITENAEASLTAFIKNSDSANRASIESMSKKLSEVQESEKKLKEQLKSSEKRAIQQLERRSAKFDSDKKELEDHIAKLEAQVNDLETRNKSISILNDQLTSELALTREDLERTRSELQESTVALEQALAAVPLDKKATSREKVNLKHRIANAKRDGVEETGLNVPKSRTSTTSTPKRPSIGLKQGR